MVGSHYAAMPHEQKAGLLSYSTIVRLRRAALILAASSVEEKGFTM